MMTSQPKVSMTFSTLQHLSKHSTFNPIIPNAYKSTELLWSHLLDQAYAHDKNCISRGVFNKTNKRLQMLAKLVYTFEDIIWKPEHMETLASTRKAGEVSNALNFHCNCCVENIAKIHALETQVQEKIQCTVERGREICVLESRLSDKESLYSDMDKELLGLYTEINQLRNNAVSTDAVIVQLRQDLAAKTQIIADLQQVIVNLSRPGANSTVPTKQVCVSGTAQGETAALAPRSPNDQISEAIDTRGQVERSLQFTPKPGENRWNGRFQEQDNSWGQESGWPFSTSNPPTRPDRQEEVYPNHSSMERINFLLRICKEIPKYDPNVDPFTSCDLFEGHCNKYSVAPEYRMELFKLWLPTHFNQRYEVTGRTQPMNGQYYDKEERLSILMKLATGHWDVTPDILSKFKPTIQDEPLSLCSRFEAMYRRVTKDQGMGIPQGMVRMFVEKFPYLDTAIRLSAARETSLADAAIIIKQYRQDILHNKKFVKVREHVPVHVKSQDERVPHNKFTSNARPTAPPFQRTGSIRCFFCLQTGHMKRNWPQWLRSRTIPEKTGNNNGFKLKPNYYNSLEEHVDTDLGYLHSQSPKRVAIVNTPEVMESNESIPKDQSKNSQVAVCTSQVPTGSLVDID
ncbi:uncharacterized protein LOC121393867 [Xenopus laevis]|uniref:Uncharacterized protein LOC121393867 n=1 Tax=Xenopus laevis TaxID=8355 RepID=A0A8J1KQG3_XENLA|nr:uncharacterized protein LOC121393867 [Xenopus laevis]